MSKKKKNRGNHQKRQQVKENIKMERKAVSDQWELLGRGMMECVRDLYLWISHFFSESQIIVN